MRAPALMVALAAGACGPDDTSGLALALSSPAGLTGIEIVEVLAFGTQASCAGLQVDVPTTANAQPCANAGTPEGPDCTVASASLVRVDEDRLTSEAMHVPVGTRSVVALGFAAMSLDFAGCRDSVVIQDGQLTHVEITLLLFP